MGQVRSHISVEGLFHIFDEAWGSMAYRTFIVPFFYSFMYLHNGDTEGKLDLLFVCVPLLYISRPMTTTFIYNI